MDQASSQILSLSNNHTFKVLPLIFNWQQRHGLRHADYQHYRHFCSKKLQKLRKTLNFPLISKNKVQNRYVSKESLKDEKYMWILLLEAERCWAYAIELKQESNTEPRKRYRTKNRLKKLCIYSKKLMEIVKDSYDGYIDEKNKIKCDTRSLLESQAYHYWALGSWYFECVQWEECLKYMKKAKFIYDEMLNLITHATSQAYKDSVETFYKQRREEINTAIRFSTYNLEKAKQGKDIKNDAEWNEFQQNTQQLLHNLSNEMKQKQILVKDLFPKSDVKPIEAYINTENLEDTFPQFLQRCTHLEAELLKELQTSQHLTPDEANSQTTPYKSGLDSTIGDLTKPGDNVEESLDSFKTTKNSLTVPKKPGKRRRKMATLKHFETHLAVGNRRTVLKTYDKLLSECALQIKAIGGPASSKMGVKTADQNTTPIDNSAANDCANMNKLKRYVQFLQCHYLLGRRLYRFFTIIWDQQYLPSFQLFQKRFHHPEKASLMDGSTFKSIKFRPKANNKALYLFHKRFTPYLITNSNVILQTLEELQSYVECLAVDATQKEAFIAQIGNYLDLFKAIKFKILGDYYDFKRKFKPFARLEKGKEPLESTAAKCKPRRINTKLCYQKSKRYYKMSQEIINELSRREKDPTNFVLDFKHLLKSPSHSINGLNHALFKPGFANDINYATIYCAVVQTLTQSIEEILNNMVIKRALVTIRQNSDQLQPYGTINYQIIQPGERSATEAISLYESLMQPVSDNKLAPGSKVFLRADQVIQIPPPMKPVMPCKPVFFDIARDEIRTKFLTTSVFFKPTGAEKVPTIPKAKPTTTAANENIAPPAEDEFEDAMDDESVQPANQPSSLLGGMVKKLFWK